MKPKPYTGWIVNLLLLAMLGWGLSAVAQVQTNPPPPTPRPPPAPPRVSRTLRLPVPPVERILTAEQLVAYHKAIEANREKVQELENQLHNARVAIAQVQLADKFDEREFREKTAVVDKLQLEISLLNAHAFRTIYPTLTAEQVDRLRVKPRPAQSPAAPMANGERPGSADQRPPVEKIPASPPGTNPPSR